MFNKCAGFKWPIIGAIAEILYCLLISWLIPFLGHTFGNNQSSTQFAVFLVILVLSVSVSGICLFGYPVWLAFKKEYKQAWESLAVGMLTFFILGILVFLIII